MTRPPRDSHADQALRVALYCERHPGQFFTADELGTACDLGSPTKVLSAMDGPLGYGMVKDRRTTLCNDGQNSRSRRVYRCISRPAKPQLDLEFPSP